jgi:pilus assembly protein FimV
MNKIPRRTGAKAFLTAALLATASAACALGLGKPPAALTLGEYLDVSIPLRLEPGEDVPDSCLTSDIYYGEDKLGLGVSRTRVETAPNGERVIRIVANARISEPVVSIYVAAGCTSKVSRKFVVFADPPATPAVVSAPQAEESPLPRATPVTPQAPVRATRTVQADAPDEAAASAVAKPRSRSTRRAAPAAMPATPGLDTRVAALDADAVAPRSKSPRKSPRKAEPVPSRGGARLQLDPIEPSDAVVDPQLRLTLSLPNLPGGDAQPSADQLARRATAAALWRALNATPEEQARDRQRLQELEARLAQLQRDGEAARHQVQELQARVRQAESGRAGSGTVLVLAGLCAALAAALSWLVWKRREDAQGNWWTASRVDSAQSEVPGPSLLTDAVPVPEVVAEPPPAPAAPPTAKPPVRPSVELPVLKKVVTAPVAKPPAAAVRPARAPVPDRQVSVEELIDLEQQAEFFLVLGQDQSAIDLLESHIDSTAGTSPLPYLKLLELYRRRDERDRYEAIRDRFNGRFNAYAPEWESDLQQGHVLADYPGVVERLQSLWATPERAMEVLQASLLKREPGDETFDLPAYRELLMLYSVARDLAERPDAGSGTRAPAGSPVDLLLPIGGGAGGAPGAPVERLTATRPVKAYPQAHRPLAVDVALPDLDTPAEQPRPSVPVDVSLDEPVPAQSSRSMDFEPVETPGPGAIRRGGGPAGS